MSFCSLIKGTTQNMCLLCLVLITSVLLNLLWVWIVRLRVDEIKITEPQWYVSPSTDHYFIDSHFSMQVTKIKITWCCHLVTVLTFTPQTYGQTLIVWYYRLWVLFFHTSQNYLWCGHLVTVLTFTPQTYGQTLTLQILGPTFPYKSPKIKTTSNTVTSWHC